MGRCIAWCLRRRPFSKSGLPSTLIVVVATLVLAGLGLWLGSTAESRWRRMGHGDVARQSAASVVRVDSCGCGHSWLDAASYAPFFLELRTCYVLSSEILVGGASKPFSIGVHRVRSGR